jgi:hypothetical protein
MTLHGQSERGQASVELLGAVPGLLLAALVAWQLALAGHTLWLGAQAARVAARAEAVGRSPAAAARSALPRSLERGLDVNHRHAGGVTVHVRVPVLLNRWHGPVSVAASSSFGGSR